jgi:hypothetical protein
MPEPATVAAVLATTDLPSPSAWHAFVYTVGLPLTALLVVLVLEAVGSNDTRAVWLIKAGSDISIAALGMSGHLFGDRVLAARLGDFYAAIVMFTVLIVLFFVGVSLHVRRTQYFMNLPEWMKVGIVVLGGLLSIVWVAFVATWGSGGAVWKK